MNRTYYPGQVAFSLGISPLSIHFKKKFIRITRADVNKEKFKMESGVFGEVLMMYSPVDLKSITVELAKGSDLVPKLDALWAAQLLGVIGVPAIFDGLQHRSMYMACFLSGRPDETEAAKAGNLIYQFYAAEQINLPKA